MKPVQPLGSRESRAATALLPVFPDVATAAGSVPQRNCILLIRVRRLMLQIDKSS